MTFRQAFSSTVSGLGRTKYTNAILHIVIVAMFAACLGLPILHGYADIGFGLDALISALLAVAVGVVCHVILVVILAAIELYESRNRSS